MDNNVATIKKTIISRKKRAKRNLNDRQAILMLLPQILGFLVFTLYPIVWVISLAWFDYNGVNFKFIGFDNFIRVFTRDAAFWNSILYTVLITVLTLSIQLPLALVSAIILNIRGLRLKTLFRTVFYLPNIISTAIIALIFNFLFSSFNGIINNLLLQFGLIVNPINWFGNKWSATVVIILVSVWQGFGVNMLLFLSGLAGIPAELYESAKIDGASKWKCFRHVTLPMLRPVMQIICMLSILGGLKSCDLILVLTNGNPAGKTEVVMTYIFKKFFVFSGDVTVTPQIGYAASLGVVTTFIIGIITIIYLRMTKKMNSV